DRLALGFADKQRPSVLRVRLFANGGAAVIAEQDAEEDGRHDAQLNSRRMPCQVAGPLSAPHDGELTDDLFETIEPGQVILGVGYLLLAERVLIFPLLLFLIFLFRASLTLSLACGKR